MTCLVGIATKPAGADVGESVARMLSGAHREPWYIESTHVDESGRYAIGSLRHDFQAAGSPDHASGHLRAWAFGDSYPSNSDRGERTLPESLTQDEFDASRQRGAFVATRFDESSGVLEVINDRFGQRPLYYTVQDGVMRYSTSVPALAADGVEMVVSPGGLAQFFTFGQYLDCDTLFRDIRVLPAGSRLCFDTNSGECRVDAPKASDAGHHSIEGGSEEDWIERISEAMFSAIRAASDRTDGLGVALSGGLDARTILGLIDHESNAVKTICLGMPGSLDLRCAQQMAEMVGCDYHAHLLDVDFLNDFEKHLYHMIDLTGGQYLSQCIVLPTLPVYRQQGIQTLLRGHAGELMHMSKAYAFSIDDEALSISTRNQAKDWLFRHLQAYMLDGVSGNLFRGEYASAMDVAPRDAFERDFSQIPELDDPRQAIWHAFVNTRLRRETTLSLGKFASVCNVRVPMLDHDLIDLLLAAPVELKLGETIQRAILKRYRPEFLRVINANTGAPMTAGPMMRRVGELKMRVLAKLGFPGYQPYERLGLWLRREIRPLVEKLLLDEECLDRGVFDPDVLRLVLQEHYSGKSNHTYLILAMMIFEAGQHRLANWGCEQREAIA